jgi:hypothetical protein
MIRGVTGTVGREAGSLMEVETAKNRADISPEEASEVEGTCLH